MLYYPITNQFYDSNKCELTGIFFYQIFQIVILKNNNMNKFHKPDNCFLGI
jgi:hypothetical protein